LRIVCAAVTRPSALRSAAVGLPASELVVLMAELDDGAGGGRPPGKSCCTNALGDVARGLVPSSAAADEVRRFATTRIPRPSLGGTASGTGSSVAVSTSASSTSSSSSSEVLVGTIEGRASGDGMDGVAAKLRRGGAMLSIPAWPVAVPSSRPLVPESGMGASSGGGVDCRETTRDGLEPSALVADDEGPASTAALLAGRAMITSCPDGAGGAPGRESSGWAAEALDELPTSDTRGDELCELSDEWVEPFGRT
jgi:hypothetical protein